MLMYSFVAHSFMLLYRCFKQFDERAFLMDLHVIPFENVYNFSDPNVALSHWIDLFLDVINKYAPPPPNIKAGETANTSTMAEH